MLDPTAALLVIDVQDGFEDPRWGPRNNPGAEDRIAELLAAWRARERPVVHVRHLSSSPDSPLRSGQPGCEIKAVVRPLPGERVVEKSVNSAFIGTDLEAWLRERGIAALVVTGLTTDHCVSTTVRMAANLGFETYLVADATATFAKRGFDGTEYDPELTHDTALASIHGEFAEVLAADALIRRLD